MKPKTWTHPKFAALSAMLGIGRAYACGILNGLWHLAATFSEDTGILPYPAEQLVAWLEVDIDPDTLVAALVRCGWLENTPDGLRVHDWQDHRPNYVNDRIRMRRVREQSRTVSNNSPACPPSPSPSPSPLGEEESSYEDSPHNAPRSGATNGHKLFVIPLTGGASYRLPADRVAEYAATFSWDVPAEIAKAVLWLKDNPDRRPRSHRGAAAFVTRWMNRHDDRQRVSGGPGATAEKDYTEYRKDLDRRTRKTIEYVTGAAK